MTRMRKGGSIVASFILLSSTSAFGGGAYLPGAGPQSQARAGAFVAKADDPSALLNNPAGLSKGVGTVIQIGANFVDYSLTFKRTGSYETPVVDDGAGNRYPTVRDLSKPQVGIGGFQALPVIAVSTDFGLGIRGLRFGLGVVSPSAFPERNFGDYDFEDPTRNPPPGRYDVMKQTTSAAFPSVGVSYSFDRETLGNFGELDIGARFGWGIVAVKSELYTWAIRNYEEDIANDSLFSAEMNDYFVPEVGVGILYRPNRRAEFGLTYHASSNIEAVGDSFSVLGSGLPALGGVQEELIPASPALCAEGGELGALKSCLEITLPQSATVGGRFIILDDDGKERGDIELDVRWEDWSEHSNYRNIVDAQSSSLGLRVRESLVAHGLKDTLSVRLGGAYSWPIGNGRLIVRAGVAHDTETADKKWNRIDFDTAPRTTLGTGVAWEGRSYRVEVGGGAVIEPDRFVPSCNPDIDDPTCAGFTANSPSPSPAQPLQGPNNQLISPYNSGNYSSGYAVGSLGITTWF